ncbi:hypothetical protein NE237_018123 [Protea cynaroides]|uniref:Protein kinase domain-containing protein n=1 Tax=Protea cynaroides TaxID=273540 RepID=A0A9Q0K9A3_9MAGN|nr:hypothetical protein NE237_018123 [Protea cynaroides]
MHSDGNLVQYPIETPDTGSYSYWASGITGFTLMILYESGTTLINNAVFYRMTIDVDGIFRVYSISLSQKYNWSNNWESSTDKCDPKGICGFNSYCSLMDHLAECKCLPGFNFINESDHSLGCQQMTNLNAEGYCGINEAQQSIFVSTLLGRYVNCEVAMFQNQECRKQKLPLRYGKRIIEIDPPISNEANIVLVEEIGLRSFTYDELEKVTQGFKEEVGREAFSVVFKGTLPNERKINVARDFQAEMRVIAKTHHRNLVQLLGYGCDDPNRLLVYEYMSNGSLADFLFKSERPPCWQERCYTQIIHCDIKPQNILMDEYRCPKISDFGLSKLGYVAPEWHRNSPVTVKADVYSYGVMFLEIICLRRGFDLNVPKEQIILTEWVYNCFEAGEIGKLVGDDEKVDKETLDRVIKIPIWYVQDEPSLRPSMKKVVLMLEGTVEVPIPPNPISFLNAM